MLRLSPDPKSRAQIKIPAELVDGGDITFTVKPIMPARMEQIVADAKAAATTFIDRYRGKPGEPPPKTAEITRIPHIDEDELLAELATLSVIEALEEWSGIGGFDGQPLSVSPDAVRMFAQRFRAATFHAAAKLDSGELWEDACPLASSNDTQSGSETTQKAEPGA